MTPEERTAEITKGWGAIATTNFSAPGSYPPVVFIENGGEWARALIADAIRAAVAEERERCAKVAEERAAFNRDNCPATCKCADGWHIAWAIRAECAPVHAAPAAELGGEA